MREGERERGRRRSEDTRREGVGKGGWRERRCEPFDSTFCCNTSNCTFPIPLGTSNKSKPSNTLERDIGGVGCALARFITQTCAAIPRKCNTPRWKRGNRKQQKFGFGLNFLPKSRRKLSEKSRANALARGRRPKKVKLTFYRERAGPGATARAEQACAGGIKVAQGLVFLCVSSEAEHQPRSFVRLVFVFNRNVVDSCKVSTFVRQPCQQGMFRLYHANKQVLTRCIVLPLV